MAQKRRSSAKNHRFFYNNLTGTGGLRHSDWLRRLGNTMVQAQLQLFLNAEGRKAFPGWLRFFGKVVRQFDGFINIQLLQVEGSSSLGLVLIFETKSSQDAFFASPIFEQLMSRMRPHALQPYRKTVLRAKNLYNYKKSASAAAKPATPQAAKAPAAEKIEKPCHTEMKVPIKKTPPKKRVIKQETETEDNVVGMAAFMAARQK